MQLKYKMTGLSRIQTHDLQLRMSSALPLSTRHPVAKHLSTQCMQLKATRLNLGLLVIFFHFNYLCIFYLCSDSTVLKGLAILVLFAKNVTVACVHCLCFSRFDPGHLFLIL